MQENQSNIKEFINLRDQDARNQEIRKIQDDARRARLAAEITGFALNIKDDLMISTRGAPKNAFARQLAMYLTHVGFGISLSRVAVTFGRDRTTIAYACRLIEDKRDDSDFDLFVDNLEKILLSIPIFEQAA
jgi:chromosomal replication initiation ATPase DnaA